ncbi:MAG: hypothetical protein M4D80_15725 [Myxococcota bacterium]|nr:hypothetical protein [Myxococcota bacterium]
MTNHGTIRTTIFVLGIAACVDTPPAMQNNEPEVSYRRDVQPVWDKWCVGCHNFHTPHLVRAESASDLMGVSWFKCNQGVERAAFVVPGDPASSFLMYKLTGDNPNHYWDREACDRLMPADQNGQDIPLVQLDPVAVQTVKQWIEQGAVFD